MSDVDSHPTHLDPSELGTKDYWDKYYQRDLDHVDGEREEEEDDETDEQHDDPPTLTEPEDLESWFDDVDAPSKILEYLTSETFPLSPYYDEDKRDGPSRPYVLDLGTGNGSMLFRLRMAGYTGVMTGVDYSQQSVDLANKLYEGYMKTTDAEEVGDEGYREDMECLGWATMRFAKVDLIRENPLEAPWWPRHGGYHLVLDKGTFDAISLSEETVTDAEGKERRICEVYPKKVVDMMNIGGYFLITSCNWTEDEILKWFLKGDGVEGQLELFGKIDYPTFEFGGNTGSGVVSLCFKRVGLNR